MADLAVQVRLSAKDDGLVGQVQKSKSEMEALTTAQKDAATAATELAAATGQAQAALSSAGPEADKAASSVDALDQSQQNATASAADLAEASGSAKTSLAGAAGDAAKAAKAIEDVGGSSRKAKDDVDGVASALGDLNQGASPVADMFGKVEEALGGLLGTAAEGAAPLGDLADKAQETGGAVIESLGEGGKAGAVAAFLAGPWGIVIGAAASILGTLALGALEASYAAEELADQQDTLRQFVDRTTGSIRNQTFATLALAAAQSEAKRLDQQTAAYAETRKRLIKAGLPLGGAEDAGPQLASIGFTGESAAKVLGGLNPGQSKAQQEIAAQTRLYAAGTINADAYGQAVNRIGQSNPAVKGLTDELVRQSGAVIQSARAAGTTKALLATLTGTATDADRALLRQGKSAASAAGANFTLLDAYARLGSATDALGNAQANLDIVRQKARAAVDAGSLSEAGYTKQVTEAEKAVAVARASSAGSTRASTAAARDHTVASRGSAQASREVAKEQRDLQSALERAERRFDPAAASARSYADVLEDIAELEAAGKLGSDRAFDFRMQALEDATKERAKRESDRFRELIGPDAARQMDAIADSFGDRIDRGLQEAADNFERSGLRAADAIAGLIGGGVGGGLQNVLRLFNDQAGLGSRPPSPGEGLLAGRASGLSSFLFGGSESSSTRRDRSLASAETDVQYKARVTDAHDRGEEPLAFRSPTADAGGFAGGLQSVASTFEKSLDKTFDRVFGEKGIFPEGFSKTLGKAFGYGSVGGSIGGAFGSKTGGTVGGALGGLAGEKFLTKALGDFAGPFGSIAGGILGGVLGSALKSTPRASATITSVDDKAAVAGNNAGLRQAASGLATSVQGGLQQIADALQGELGSFAVSIGVRDKNLRVDTSGSGITKTKKGAIDFGEDEGGAISFAIADAIADGAIQGLSPKVAAALQSNDNIDKAIKEALNVQSLETLLDGIDGAIGKTFKDIERQIAERNRIAKKYGFDMVKLEEQNAKDRKAAFEQVLAERTGPLQALLKDLSFGNLFEGTLTDQRNKILAEITKAESDAASGKEGATQQVADLRRQLLDISRNSFGTAGSEYAADLNSSRAAAERIIEQENARVKEQADLARGTNDKLDTNNKLTDETNSLLAEATTYLSRIAADSGQVAAPVSIGGGGNRRLLTERVAEL